MVYENKKSILNSFPGKRKDAKKNGFTLVELIVVITIIAILGTIAFISLQGYSKQSRNSTRISDLSTMKTSLELFNLDAGKYPTTTEGFQVTYSGTEVWTQGTFGTSTTTNVTRLDKIPNDPLTGKEYTYSTTKNKQEYQLAGMIEGDEVTLNNTLLNQTNAGDKVVSAIVTGNYNGIFFKTNSGTNCEVLSVPSIVSNQPNTVTDLKVILDSKGLVYTGFNNLPSNYEVSKYKTDEGFEFTTGKLVIYSDEDNCNPLYAEDAAARVELITNLQLAYSGTIIENEDNINQILEINTNNADEVNLMSTSLVNNSLGGSVVAANANFSYIDCNAGSITGITYNAISYTYSSLNHAATTAGLGSEVISFGTKNYTGTVSCNNGVVSISEEGEIIDCTTGYVEQGGACIQDQCAGSTPSNSASNATIQLALTNWSFNNTPGTCTFVCDSNYTWNGSNACVADTQVLSCTGKPATHSSYNTATSITQTWNGSSWLPTTSALYNETASSTSCRYKCDTGYILESNNCIVAPPNGVNISANTAKIAWDLGSTTQGWYSGSYTITNRFTAGKVCEGLYCYTDGLVWLYGSANILCVSRGYKGAISGTESFTEANILYHVAHLGDGQFNDQIVPIITKHLELVTCVN